MNDMWAVSSGEYSYYRVHCLFPTEALAVAHKDRRNLVEGHEEGAYGAAFVERFDFYDDGEPAAKVFWHANGYYGNLEKRETRVWSNVVWSNQNPKDHPVLGGEVPSRPLVETYPHDGGGGHVTATASTKKAAVKAVSDVISRKNAELEGVT